MIKILLLWAWRKWRLPCIQDRVATDIVRKCDRGHISFDRGDRVQAIDHRTVDDEGGYGTIEVVGYTHPELNCVGYRVRFDSMPKHLLFMPGSELQYERK